MQRVYRLAALLVVVALVISACGGQQAAAPAPAATQAPAAKPTDAPKATEAPKAAPTQAQAATQAPAPKATDAPKATEAPKAAATTAPAALSGEAVKIGIAVAQTSNVALFGQEQVQGAQIAEDLLNKAGGINGRPIKLVYQDTAGDEAGTINAFNTLINNDKVVAIVGPTLSQQAFAADPIADKAGVPVIGPSNTAAGIPEIGDYIARVSAPVTVVAPNAVRAALAANPGAKRVAVFYAQNDAFSKSETVVFQRTVTDTLKLELATVQTHQTTDTDFTTQATNGIAAKPDMIIISGLAADSGNLVKQLRELGFKGPIVGGNGLNTPNLFPVCKAQCDGIFVAQAYSNEAATPVNQAFVAAFKAKFQKDPGQFSGQSYAAVQVVVEALKALDQKTKLDTMDLAKQRSELNKQILAGTYDTTLGKISFTDKGDIKQEAFYTAQIKMNPDGNTGRFVFLK